MATLQSAATLDQFADSILQDPTGQQADITTQITDEARPTLSGVLSSLDIAGERAGGAFTTAEGTLERQQRALGQTQSASELRVQQRRLGLGRALSTVDARNREVSNIRQRADIARSSAGNLRDIIESQQAGAFGFSANAEAQREARFQGALAKHKSQKTATLGTIAAIGLSFVPGGAFLAPAALAATSGG